MATIRKCLCTFLCICTIMAEAGETDAANNSNQCAITVSIPLIELARFHMPWEWQSGHFYQIQRKDNKIATEDTVSVFLCNPEKPGFFDVWVWRSERSGRTALAEDMHGVLQSDGTIKVKRDSGQMPWRVYRPLTFEGGIIPRYKYDIPPAGSACDVKAYYNYEDGILSVEFSRLTETLNSDDIKIIPNITRFAVTSLPPDKIKLSDLKFSVYRHRTPEK